MSQPLPTPGREPVTPKAHEKFMRTLAFQYAAQARMERERRDAALRRIAALVDALPEVEPDSVMMVSVKAQAIRALREAVAEWRVKP